MGVSISLESQVLWGNEQRQCIDGERFLHIFNKLTNDLPRGLLGDIVADFFTDISLSRSQFGSSYVWEWQLVLTRDRGKLSLPEKTTLSRYCDFFLNSHYPSKPLEASYDGGVRIEVEVKDFNDATVETYERHHREHHWRGSSREGHW
jgi:hypothetical protein